MKTNPASQHHSALDVSGVARRMARAIGGASQ
jgi:hypothetical protein